MSLDLANYEVLAQEAIKLFWRSRDAALTKQIESGGRDSGSRGAVTAGRNMDGFLDIGKELVRANGLESAEICVNRRALTLPGYFRSTKLWDMLVVYKGELVAAIEFKSQVGPSFGNNLNNRAEEAIGTAHDFWTAYREGAFGRNSPRPFLGWLMLLEDCPKSNSPLRNGEPHFPVDSSFKSSSYVSRYDILCRRLVKEKLYNSACLLVSSRDTVAEGKHRQMSEFTSLKIFVSSFAGHIASVATRYNNG